MFDSLIPGNESKVDRRAEREAEDRQVQHAKESEAFTETMRNDEAYMQEHKERSDLIRWQQDLDDDLQKLVHKLKAHHQVNGVWVRQTEKVWDEETDTIIEQYKIPMVNDLFIDQVVIPQCEPFLSRNIFNSNLDETRILTMLKRTMNEIADAMCDGYDVYGIEFRNFGIVDNLIRITIIPSPFRSLQGWNKRMDNMAIRRIESFNESTQSQPQQKGIFGGMTNNG